MVSWVLEVEIGIGMGKGLKDCEELSGIGVESRV